MLTHDNGGKADTVTDAWVNQPRNQGRFAEKDRREAPVELHEIDMSDDTGLWNLPPHHDNAEDLTRFWSEVKIPDRVTSNFYIGASNSLRREENQVWDEVAQRSADKPPTDTLSPAYEQWQARHVDEASHLWQQMKGYSVDRMPPESARSLIRVTRMVQYADQLPETERDSVLHGTKIILSKGGEGRTPAELWETYRLGDYAQYIADPDDTDSETLRALAAQSAYLARTTERISSHVDVVANAIHEENEYHAVQDSFS